MNLDWLAAMGCGWIALCCFSLYAFTHPKRDRWMNMPNYVRRGLAICGAAFCWRSVNFIMLEPVEVNATGHINAEGIMVMLAVAYTITALALWAGVFKRLPAHGWDRLHFAEHEEREGKVPVMMTPAEVRAKLHEEGAVINTEPPRKKVAMFR